jgi:hypothetical protein
MDDFDPQRRRDLFEMNAGEVAAVIMLSEANRFVWPGPDMRPLRNEDISSVALGLLPYNLAEEIRLKFIAYLKAAARKSSQEQTENTTLRLIRHNPAAACVQLAVA